MDNEGYTALILVGRGVIGEYGLLEYFTGFYPGHRPSYAVCFSGRPPALVVTSPAQELAARQQGCAGDIILATSAPTGQIAGVIREIAAQGKDPTRIGIGGFQRILPAGDLDVLRSSLPYAEIRDATQSIAAIKAIKTAEDLQKLRDAAALADHGLRTFATRATVGRTESELATEIELTVRGGGARDLLVFVTAGPVVGTRSTGRRFSKGDVATVFVELSTAGYWVEVGAIYTFGEPKGPQGRFAYGCLEAANRVESMLRSGVATADVANVMANVIKRSGGRSTLGFGHGVGVDQDPPTISSSDSSRVEADAAIAIHPTLAHEDLTIGAGVANTYLVGRDSLERLSEWPSAIHQLPGQHPRLRARGPRVD